MADTPNYPTMADYIDGCRKRAQKRLLAKPNPERFVYAQQMGFVREGAKYSGIEQWTQNHTMGALFATSSIKSGFDVMHKAGVLNHEDAELLKMAIEMQEDIIVHMNEDT